MAVPKKRTSSARRDKRRATYRIRRPRSQACPVCQGPRLAHRVCPTCGTYAGREVVSQRPEPVPGADEATTEE